MLLSSYAALTGIRLMSYYMVQHRTSYDTLLMAGVAAQEGRATDAENRAVPLVGEATREAIRAAKTAEDLWQAIRVDSWAVVPIASAWRPGHVLEGTRLTLVPPCRPTLLRSLSARAAQADLPLHGLVPAMVPDGQSLALGALA